MPRRTAFCIEFPDTAVDSYPGVEQFSIDAIDFAGASERFRPVASIHNSKSKYMIYGISGELALSVTVAEVLRSGFADLSDCSPTAQ
jgi:hypothetical protein